MPIIAELNSSSAKARKVLGKIEFQKAKPIKKKPSMHDNKTTN